MHLVMFKFAIEHISRVGRVLKQDNGHVLLAGLFTLTLRFSCHVTLIQLQRRHFFAQYFIANFLLNVLVNEFEQKNRTSE